MSSSVTVADVALWGKFNAPTAESEEETLLQRVIDAVAGHIVENYVVDDDAWTDAQEIAHLLQVSRLWRRRDTPNGIAAFADVAAMRIDSLDRDVAMMLTPQVNFA
jgi:hypothetical protein